MMLLLLHPPQSFVRNRQAKPILINTKLELSLLRPLNLNFLSYDIYARYCNCLSDLSLIFLFISTVAILLFKEQIKKCIVIL